MIAHQPFDELEIPSRKRQIFLIELFTKTVREGVSIAILSKKEPKLSTINTENSIASSALFVSKITPWHYSNFCIVFAELSFVERLIQQTELWDKPLFEIEAALQIQVLGYCEAIDNGLVCYGNSIVQDIVSSVSITDI